MKTSTNHICTQCSKRQLTCCQDSDPFVTLGDIQRISKEIGHSNFFERRLAGKSYLQATKDFDDPLWNEVTIRDNTRRVTKKASNNVDCIFLSCNGCVLPEDIKPLVCRIYPYDFIGTKLMLLDPACPKDLVGKCPPKDLGITRKSAQKLLNQLYKELKYEEIMNRKFGVAIKIP